MTTHAWTNYPEEQIPGAPDIEGAVADMLRAIRGRVQIPESTGSSICMKMSGWLFAVDLSTGKILRYLRPAPQSAFFRLEITTNNYVAVARAYEVAKVPFPVAPTDPLPWRPRTLFEAGGDVLPTLLSSLACRGMAFRLVTADDESNGQVVPDDEFAKRHPATVPLVPVEMGGHPVTVATAIAPATVMVSGQRL